MSLEVLAALELAAQAKDAGLTAKADPRQVTLQDAIARSKASTPELEVLGHAYRLARQGFRLFPVFAPKFDGRDKDGKIPAVRGWPELATSNPGQITAWFGETDYSVGIATGRGTLVLDIDRASEGGHKADGAPALAALETKHGPLPKTLEARTGSGGRHLYFRTPEGVGTRNTAGKLAPALDTRGDGGYVLAPPSMHASGRRYEWIDSSAPIADAPAWLLELIREPERPRRAEVTREFPAATPEILAAAEAHVASYSEKNPTGPGNGNADAVNVGAMLLNDWGLDLETEALPIARRHNAVTHNPREEGELLEALENGARYAKGPFGEKRHGFVGPEDVERIRRMLKRLIAAKAANEPAAATAPSPEASEPEASEPPTRVFVTTREADVADVVIATLARRDSGDFGIYSRLGSLVTLERHDGVTEGSCRIPRGTPMIQILRPEALRDRITKHCDLVRPALHGGASPVHVPGWLSAAILARGYWPGVRYLDGVIEAPTLRPDGSLLDSPGYDVATGLLLLDRVRVEVPAAPTPADAASAARELLEVVADFPFATIEHQAAWVSFVLTLLARDAIDGCTPLVLLDAPTAGSGKSLLADLAAVITTGRGMPRRGYSPDDEESRKTLVTVLLEGMPAVLFDNIKNGTSLGSPTLDAITTGRVFSDRLLGANRSTGDLPIRTVFSGSGNNIGVAGDLHRRTLHIRLAPRQARPEEREGFRHPDLLGWVKAERARLLSAALIILRAYVVAGTPPMPGKPWGGFMEWSRLIRGAVLFAGLPDPYAGRSTLVEVSEAGSSELASFLEALLTSDPLGRGRTTAELAAREGAGRIKSPAWVALEALAAPKPGVDLNTLAAGKVLGRWVDHVVETAAGAVRLRKRVSRGAVHWYAERVSP